MAEKYQLKALITGVDQLTPKLEGIRAKVAGFRKGMEKVGVKRLGIADAFKGAAIIAPLMAASKAAIGLESNMADVRKVVDFDTPEQFKQMGQDVINLSKRLPMAVDGIAQIVAAGGQASIPRKELLRFAEDAIKMGVAFDTTAEESGDMMAKWRTSFKMTQDEVVGLADKINYLSNNGPAKSGQISEIVTRIGSLGGVAGLSSGQIAAMGATLTGVGVQSEVSATGMKNFMLTLTSGASATKKQRAAFKALRLDSKQVAKDMQKDAQGTILKVLGRIKDVDKTAQAGLLTQMFGRESIAAIAPMLTRLDLLKKNLDMVGDSTKYTGSMQKEYEARAATTANNMQLLKNQVSAVAVNLGNTLLPAINAVIKSLTPYIDALSQWIAKNPELIKTIIAVSAAMIGMRLGITGIATSLTILNKVIGLSPMGVFIRLLAIGAGLIIANWKEVAPFFTDIFNVISGATQDALNWFRSLIGLDPIDFKNYWHDFGLVIDDLRAKTVWLFEEFEKFQKAADRYVPGKNMVAKWVTGIDADAVYANYNKNNVIPKTQVPMINNNAAQAMQKNNQAVSGLIEVKFDNAPQGMTVTNTQSDSGVGIRTNQNVGRRSIQ